MISKAPGQEFEPEQQPFVRQTNKALKVDQQFNLTFQRCGWLDYDDHTVILKGFVQRIWKAAGPATEGAPTKTVYSKAVNLCR